MSLRSVVVLTEHVEHANGEAPDRRCVAALINSGIGINSSIGTRYERHAAQDESDSFKHF